MEDTVNMHLCNLNVWRNICLYIICILYLYLSVYKLLDAERQHYIVDCHRCCMQDINYKILQKIFITG